MTGRIFNSGSEHEIDCSYPAAHASEHREHPDSGRPVCLACHPPAAVITGAVTAQALRTVPREERR